MTSELEREFHQAMVRIYERAREEARYNATRFLRMVSEQGGLAAARTLLRSQPSDGFTALWQAGRLDLSVEAHVLLPRFQPLFTDAERESARRRLEQYGFAVDGWLRAQAGGVGGGDSAGR